MEKHIATNTIDKQVISKHTYIYAYEESNKYPTEWNGMGNCYSIPFICMEETSYSHSPPFNMNNSMISIELT
jgi:hypothetical protein